MRVNLIGPPLGGTINSHLVPLFWREGWEAYVNGCPPRAFDLTIFCGLWYIDQRYFDTPCIALAVGSDVYRGDPGVRLDLLKNVKTVLLADEAMRPYLEPYHKDLRHWHVPIDTEMFKDFFSQIEHMYVLPKRDVLLIEHMYVLPKRDVLLYCGAPDHQDLNRIMKYIKEHPYRSCTLLGRGYQDGLMEEYPNLLSVRWIPYYSMPYIYYMHSEYRLYLKRKVDHISKMTCEALYMGCRAFSNDKQITAIPSYMLDYNAMPRIMDIIGEVL